MRNLPFDPDEIEGTTNRSAFDMWSLTVVLAIFLGLVLFIILK